MALITASGITWLGRQARLTAPGRRYPALASLAPALPMIAIAALLADPQQVIRTSGARPDNLVQVAAVIAAQVRQWRIKSIVLTLYAHFNSHDNVAKQ